MAKQGRKGGGLWGLVKAVIVAGLMIFVIGPIIVVAVYRFVPPPVTFLMVQRVFEGHGLERRWVPMRRISPNLVRAVIAAEDARFCEHRGFDVEAIEKAMAANAAGKALRGGSTISQQTAKNVFLWPGRDWVRKGLEAWFTVLIEIGWGKERIMEVYLNSIEWGPGVYGAEMAAQRNFHVPASQLTVQQSARLAAIVPKPLSWKAARPGPYMKRRAGSINRNARAVRREGLTACVL
ncbi:monofunctional biosynthetic peptidoglycan transglycosylase [Phenylobacterium sp.]|uniref:monofunctional biosynthetic peptidoglycan transglycosylase n=1 Tax=Phenylobacterium sp. TaxID=1871053 RepID=UPI0025F7E88C|nr:monofunctional biosynthetic peptidoglycan transglycosylase [Phenylobacterium sp.]MBX3483878.1 monofunctional biosynthetic peptidoglycan transglycosylase [Phenylobacterium sp.]MCW5758332.1 monofunctional biosynthetic peptidoglycan transglycosylase [Phenylobacterium sp.]